MTHPPVVKQPHDAQFKYQEALDAVKELAGLFAQSGELQARIVKMLDHGSLKPGDQKDAAKITEAIEDLVDDFTEGKLVPGGNG